MLARIGCYCKIMVFSPLKLEVTYYIHPTQSNPKCQIPYYHPLNQWLLWATNGNQGQTVMDL